MVTFTNIKYESYHLPYPFSIGNDCRPDIGVNSRIDRYLSGVSLDDLFKNYCMKLGGYIVLNVRVALIKCEKEI